MEHDAFQHERIMPQNRFPFFMIHLTLIIVDFLTGLLAAGAWAILSAGGAIAGIVGGGLLSASLFRKWWRKS